MKRSMLVEPRLSAIVGGLTMSALSLSPITARADEPAPVDPIPAAGNEAPVEPPAEFWPTPEPAATPEPGAAAQSLGAVQVLPTTRPVWDKGGTGLVIGLKLGGAIPSVFNDFEAAFVPELEFGFMLPFAERTLEIFVSGRWSAPSSSGTSGPDARLPGDGMMSWDLKQQTASLGLGLRLRIDAGDLVIPYVAAGGRVNLMRFEVSGEAGGEPFGNNEETGTFWGFFGAVGAELHVGPGAILLEVQLNQVGIDAWVLRDTNLSSLDIFAGYRFMF